MECFEKVSVSLKMVLMYEREKAAELNSQNMATVAADSQGLAQAQGVSVRPRSSCTILDWRREVIKLFFPRKVRAS